MKLRITVLAIISEIFLPLYSANSFSKSEYQYGFYWGSLNSICAAYSIDAMSDEDAGMILNSLVKMGNERIKDSNLNNRFNKLVKTADVLKKSGCSKLIK